jgi:hypothetical protein
MSGASTLVDVVQSAADVGVGVPELDGPGDGLQLGEALGDPPPMIDCSGPGRPPPDDELGEGLAESLGDGLADADPLGAGVGLVEGLVDGLAVEDGDALAEADAEALLLGEAEGQLSAAIAPLPEAAATSTVVAPVTMAMIPAANRPPDVRVRMQCSLVDRLLARTLLRTQTAAIPSPHRFSGV